MSDSAVDGKGTTVTAVVDLPPNRVGRNIFRSCTPVSAFRTAPNERFDLTMCCGVRFAAGTSSRSAGSKKNLQVVLFGYETVASVSGKSHRPGAPPISNLSRACCAMPLLTTALVAAWREIAAVEAAAVVLLAAVIAIVSADGRCCRRASNATAGPPRGQRGAHGRLGVAVACPLFAVLLFADPLYTHPSPRPSCLSLMSQEAGMRPIDLRNKSGRQPVFHFRGEQVLQGAPTCCCCRDTVCTAAR